MPKLTNKRKKSLAKVDLEKAYPIREALELLKDKDITYTSFDASVDIAICLGIDPRKNEQMIRGVVRYPHGTGKVPRVLALCSSEKEKEAKDAGAEHVGLEDYLSKIEKGWTDVDVIVTEPSVMGKLGKLGRILGPQGLMPNPKAGTVSENIGQVILEIKKGRVEIKTDKFGLVHSHIGRVSFSLEALEENARELFQTVGKLKPSTTKGTYIKRVHVSSTMSIGLCIDKNSLAL